MKTGLIAVIPAVLRELGRVTTKDDEERKKRFGGLYDSSPYDSPPV